MSLVITGASGQLGRLVTAELLKTVEPSELILLTRAPEALDVPGAQVRSFDWNAATPAAFEGGERMLLISGPDIGARVDGHKAAVDAAVAGGVRFIAYTSIPNPSDNNPIVVAAEHRATEEHIRASGARWAMLRNNIYAEIQAPAYQAAIATGRLVTNGGPVGFVSRLDCARSAAAVLAGGDHDGREYDITGPEALGPAELAALFSELGGKPVEPVLVGDEEYISGLVKNAGMPDAVATIYSTFGIGARLGYSAVVSPAVRQLTGHDPLTLREVLS
ncbi:NAD(P)H-binding protein [Solirubrobacter sp. CPCC 204708]|uniref:NAD(P)H-binding protein n=1 Tax=Solirubrobacter deserti TaxID=2282478 RepID=A0ABT4RGE6_9ACTN|nr:NAD(P)H-binding protein [Solirubrobacter deserti]MBE2319643.1 NAD(P)H-binding protein [Solirubrobacter deserti]MDA0137618.1 NAD(P)H-binding protein [Solirubrobacter deserti]